jgi:hypothetical protein
MEETQGRLYVLPVLGMDSVPNACWPAPLMAINIVVCGVNKVEILIQIPAAALGSIDALVNTHE